MNYLLKFEEDCIRRKIPIIGPEKGEWLSKQLDGKKKILELGTANGYSGIILGSKGAELTTIEINKEIAKEAIENFKKFGIHAKVIIGDGVTEIKKLTGEYDLIFIDFAKRKYIEVLEDCIRLGKIIIADNINFPGCKDYKEKVLTDSRLKTEIINIKDGLSKSEKI
jgi:predicted O-methyltransferase YrrM